MKGKLKVWSHCFYPYRWSWEITWNRLYISSYTNCDGYTTERGARRAASKAAARLNIAVEETK